MSRKRKRKLICFAILAVIIGVIIYFQTNVTNILISMSEATIRAETAVAVNNAVFSVMGSSGVSYDELVRVEYDDNGNVALMAANSFKVNSIARNTAYMSQENLNRMLKAGVDVPIGAFTGIELFAGMGRRINLKIIPVSTVDCQFSSSFTQAGINQTLHTLYLEVVSEVTIVLPTRTKVVISNSSILLSESIIVGKIPDTYLQGSLFNSNSSLVPD